MKKNMKMMIIIAVLVLVVAIGGYVFYMINTPSTSKRQSTTTVSNAVIITKNNSSLGNYLADPSGRTLYVYGSDVTGVSNCTGSCLTTWPAYMDTGSITNLPTGMGVITRSDDGDMQYTYNGMPLYYFVSDTNGQVTGDGVGNFQVAKPTTTTTTTTTPSNSNTQSSPSYQY